jgi:flagellar export protein FliJ
LQAFSFKLEPVLRLRERAEQDALSVLGQAVRALTEIENKIKANEAEKENARASYARNTAEGQGTQSFSSGWFTNYELYTRRLDEAHAVLEAEAEKAQAQVDEARQVFAQATAARQALTELEKQERKAWRVERDKAEERDNEDRNGIKT